MNPTMLKKLQKVQKEMMDAQEQLEHSEFIGKATGVTVVVQGTRQVIDVEINKELIEDVDLLQDAILVAVNDALSQIEKQQNETMGKFQNSFGGFGF